MYKNRSYSLSPPLCSPGQDSRGYLSPSLFEAVFLVGITTRGRAFTGRVEETARRPRVDRTRCIHEDPFYGRLRIADRGTNLHCISRHADTEE